ncbi:MAG: alpha/beta hydrolase [Chloroflexi bacterium]|nr:alpha/beta hydrolase [Chloroflexota bacterium]
MSSPIAASAETNGVLLRYWTWGGTRPPLVLLHGLASTHRIWDLVAPLLAKDHTVITVDQRGHGESAKPDGGYDFATVAADINGLLQVLNIESPILVGHSWGGNVALEHAATYPGVAAGLCLVDGGTIEISSYFPSLEAATREMAPPDFSGMTLESLRARAQNMDFGFEKTPQVRQAMEANFEELANGQIQARLSRTNHMAVIEAIWDHKPSELYHRVRCPVLLMPARGRGSHSKERQERAERSLAAAGDTLPVSNTVWLEDSVHDVPLQRPDLVAGVIKKHFISGFFG